MEERHMVLLPRSKSDFASTTYWNSFFENQGKRVFEWYGEYEELKDLFHQYIKPQDSILHAGCGNSNVGMSLFDAGYKNITNIDISSVVVTQMKHKMKRTRPGLKYIKMNAMNTSFDAGSFSVIFDKGLVDSLCFENTEKAKATTIKFFEEVDRLLRLHGRYICFSILQDFVLEFIVDYFKQKGWFIRIVVCPKVDKARAEGYTYPTFAVVITKVKKLPNLMPRIEFSMSRVNSVVTAEELVNKVRSVQEAEVVCSGIRQHSLSETGSDPVIEVTAPGEVTPRYTITILESKDQKDVENMTFSAFVVPNGREDEWIFNTEEGRQLLLENCHVDRVAMVQSYGGTKYANVDDIQEELSDTVARLAPAGMIKRHDPILFLTVCPTSVINHNIRARGESEHSGEFIVEDVIEDAQHFRRLRFLKRENVIQSEVKLMKVDGSSEEQVDLSFVTNEYHMMFGVGVGMAVLAKSAQTYDVLVLGLGGGVLTSILHGSYKEISITAVEIDEAIYKIALEHFCFKPDERMRVEICDGLVFLEEAERKGQKYDAIIFDVDNKDHTVGMSCPPLAFLEKNVIERVGRLLNEQGLFLLNFVCRSSAVRTETVKTLKEVFNGIVTLKAQEDVNEVVLCWKSALTSSQELFDHAARLFYECAKQNGIIVDCNSMKSSGRMRKIKLPFNGKKGDYSK